MSRENRFLCDSHFTWLVLKVLTSNQEAKFLLIFILRPTVNHLFTMVIFQLGLTNMGYLARIVR